MTKKRWHVCWSLDRAEHNYDFYNDLWDDVVELWEISIANKPDNTWRAYVVKSSSVDIKHCRDPHFADLLDDPRNYRRIK